MVVGRQVEVLEQQIWWWGDRLLAGAANMLVGRQVAVLEQQIWWWGDRLRCWSSKYAGGTTGCDISAGVMVINSASASVRGHNSAFGIKARHSAFGKVFLSYSAFGIRHSAFGG